MFEVQTHTLCDGWVNCWSEDGKPLYFPTKEDAEAELSDFLEESEINCLLGYTQTAENPEDYHVVEVNI
jgi:hypothetical protein